MADSGGSEEEEDDEEDENDCRVVQPLARVGGGGERFDPLSLGLRAPAFGGPLHHAPSGGAPPRAEVAAKAGEVAAKAPTTGAAKAPTTGAAKAPTTGAAKASEDAKNPMENVLHYLGIHLQEMNNVEEHKNNLKVQNAGLQSELQVVKAKLQDFQASNIQLNEKIRSLRSNLSVANQDYELLSDEHKHLQIEHNNLRDENDRQLEAMQTERFSLLTQLHEKDLLVASHAKANAEHSVRIEQLESKLSDHETTMKQNEIQVKRLEASIKEKEILILHSQLAAQNAQIASDEAQVEIQQTIKRSKVAGIDVECHVCSDEIANLMFKCGHLTCCEKCHAKRPFNNCVNRCFKNNEDPGPIIKVHNLSK